MKGRPNGDLVRNYPESPRIYKNCGNFGTLAQEQFEEEARTGSARLLQATEKLFAEWERDHGFQAGAAMLLLPAGYDPMREAA